MNFSMTHHRVQKVHAVSYSPSNSHAVSFEIETDEGMIQHTLFFDDMPDAAAKAAALFYGMGGKEEDVRK